MKKVDLRQYELKLKDMEAVCNRQAGALRHINLQLFFTKWIFFARINRQREENGEDYKDVYYKFYDIKKQIVKTKLVAEMCNQKDQAEALAHSLNRENASLKFTCKELSVNNSYLKDQVFILGEKLCELEQSLNDSEG